VTVDRRWNHQDAEAFIDAAKATFPGSQELEPTRVKCECDRPLLVDDTHIGAHCLRCGHKREQA
jgi:hypothetical protein